MVKSKKSVMLGAVGILLVAIYPSLFLYSQNVQEMNFSEVVAITGYFILGALSFWAIVSLLIRSVEQAAIICMLFSAVLLNYTIWENLLTAGMPFLKYWHTFPITIVLLLHISYLLCKKAPADLVQTILLVVALTLAVLLLMNLVMAAPSIIEKMSFQKANDQQGGMIDDTGSSSGNQPNIYYFVFDEYSGFDVLQQYFNYDNQEFYNYLQEKGFSVSLNSYNESQGTAIVLTNYVNMEYVVDPSTSTSEIDRIQKEGALFPFIESFGYQVQGVGGSEKVGIPSVSGSSQKQGVTMSGENFSDLLIKNTFLYPFYEKEYSAEKQVILDAFSYMQDPENISPNNSMMTMSYLITPHQPFLFDENGNDVDSVNYNNWKDQQYYLGQLKYITKEIMKMLDNILSQDPDCVIILQSDHAARMASDAEMEDYIAPKDRTNILNAVYYRGEKLDQIQGMSGVNTVRIVLGKLFDTDLPVLEVPNYVG